MALAKYRYVTIVALLLFPRSIFSESNQQVSFEFRSAFWINLHHFLFQQSIEDPNAGQVALAALGPNQAEDWSKAIVYYRETFAGKNLLQREMARIKNALGDAGSDSLFSATGLDGDLVEILEAAAPVYRAKWWKSHDRSNRLWIDQLLPLLTQHEQLLKTRLSDAYKVEWPDARIGADVVYHANWAGAYTTLYPTRITISSEDSDPPPEEGLELLFHEASHSLIGWVEGAIGDRVRSIGKLLPRKSLWHAVLFYTTGEVLREVLPGYTPYAHRHGLWDRAWPGHLGALESEWKPYLNGDREFDAAVRALVDELAVDP